VNEQETALKSQAPDQAAKSPRFLSRFAAGISLLFVVVAAVLAFRGVGRWLIREDALAPADAIVVLSGRMPARAEQAGYIFHLGLAPEVWITHPDNPSEDLAAMGIRYFGEDDYSQAILIRQGVPQTSIHILPDSITDTEQEIYEIAGHMREEKKNTVIIVTSLPHTRRVRVLWNKLAGSDLRAVVRGAPEDSFDADHWWRNTVDALAVTREIMGLANAWTGLRVRPRPS
jgi:uncharacterized SAM-binding protein YcdF (DUF218 family)